LLQGGERTVQVRDYTQWDERYLSSESYQILLNHGHIAQIRRSLVTAIIVGGQFYGTLVLDNLRDHAPFPPEAETLAELMAEQAGVLLEQALLLERLRQTSTMLVEAEKLATLGRFIASIAHEINNPLTAVIGYADMLSEASLAPNDAEMLAQLRHGANRVRVIVRNLQIFARQQKSGDAHVSLNLLIEQALTLKSNDFIFDQIEVQADLSPELPFTWADGGKLSQVLLNLLVNAQHTLRERDLPRLMMIRSLVELGADGGLRLKLSVGDNGAGVPMELRKRIFEPFFTTKLPGEGTGLGLSICAELLADYGGTIEVGESALGGADFLITLPQRLPPEQQLAATPATPTEAVAAPVGLRILSVDDDPAVRAVIRQILQGANQVLSVSDGQQALEVLGRQSFDLLLCDLKMPDLRGQELYRLIVERWPALARRVIFISGDTSSTETRAFLAAAGRPLLSKPFHAQELYAAIAGVLGA
jgi:signal transduction histidine kinase